GREAMILSAIASPMPGSFIRSSLDAEFRSTFGVAAMCDLAEWCVVAVVAGVVAGAAAGLAASFARTPDRARPSVSATSTRVEWKRFMENLLVRAGENKPSRPRANGTGKDPEAFPEQLRARTCAGCDEVEMGRFRSRGRGVRRGSSPVGEREAGE